MEKHSHTKLTYCTFKKEGIQLKLVYSEEATKFDEISTLILTTVHTVKYKVEISQNFVAFLKMIELYLQSFFIVDFVKGLCVIILRSVCGARLPPLRDHEDQFPKSLVRLHFCPRQGHLGNEAFLCPGSKAFRIVNR